MNSIVETGTSGARSRAMEAPCPYLDDSDICSASLTLFVPAENVRGDYCGNENYDNCPIFLAKFLRRR